MMLKNQTKRNWKILDLYKSGNTLNVIGKRYKFSRSRAQQIVKSQIKKDILEELGLTRVFGEDKKLLDFAAKEEMQEISRNRRKIEKENNDNEIQKRLKDKIKQIPSYRNFISLSEYARALGEKIDIIKKYLPDIANKIVNRHKNKWSRLYNQCRSCGTSTTKHRSHGLCVKCFPKSEIFKNAQEASRIRNQDRWKKKQRKYAKEYSQRPEIIRKRKKEWDLINFDGNREKALKRDGYKCRVCGMSRSESYIRLNKDLFVKRIKEGINDINNLQTFCSKCFTRKNFHGE